MASDEERGCEERRLPENAATRDRIEQLKDSTNKLTRRTSILLILLFVLQLGLGLWSLSLQHRQGDQADKIAAQTQAIEKSREDSVRDACNDQNIRHDETIQQLKLLLTQNLLLQIANDPRTDAKTNAKVKELTVEVNSLDPKDKSLVDDSFARATKLAQPPIAQSVEGNLRFTTLLIARLSPKQNCEARIKQIAPDGTS